VKTATATGFVSQLQVMSYATPDIDTTTGLSYADWGEAASAAGLTWEPKSHQVYDYLGQPIPGYKATHGPGGVMAVTSEKWQAIRHNDHLRPVVETIMEERQAPIDALVILDGGRRVGVRVTHGTSRVPGDLSPIMKETWAFLRHDAKGALNVFENAQRLACTNQLGWLSGRAELKVRHTGNVTVKTEALIEQLGRSRNDWALWEQEMQVLRETPVNGSQFSDFTRIHIPFPIPPVSPTRAEIGQQQLFNLWDRYAGDLGLNAYAGYQAIVEYEDKVRSSRGGAGRFNRAIQPNPNKSRGLRMLMEVAR
jgi:hypothetical protein